MTDKSTKIMALVDEYTLARMSALPWGEKLGYLVKEVSDMAAENERLRTTIFTDNTQTVVNCEREIERLQIIGQETAAELGAEIEALQAEVERLKAACDKFSEAELLASAAPDVEPAAWLITSPDGDNLAQVHKPTALLSNETAVPLFTRNALEGHK